MIFGDAILKNGIELWRIDGNQTENFEGFTTLGILAEIQNMMVELKCESEQVQKRIVFMTNDIKW